MNKQELYKILDLHKKWLEGEEGGKRADLSGADLEEADLREVDLNRVDLREVNLRRAYLEEADLEGADLREVDLRGADLEGANLRGVDLRYCIGNNREIKTLQLGTYHVVICGDQIAIGCEQHLVEEWKSFSDEQILAMDDDKALNWWKLNKVLILTISSREVS